MVRSCHYFFYTLTLFVVGLSLAVGHAQEVTSEVSSAVTPSSETRCIIKLDSCVLSGDYRAIEIELRFGELIAKLERPIGAQDIVSLRTLLRERDLESAIENEQMESQTSETLYRPSDLQPISTVPSQLPLWQLQLEKFEKLQGARYEVPQSEQELKASLGFHSQVEIAGGDWMDILRVHIERTLGVEPEISELIIDVLGLTVSKADFVEGTNPQVPSIPVGSDPVIIEAD